MPPRFSDDYRPPQWEASPEFTRLFLIAVLTALALGFIGGLIWVGWNLLLHVVR